MNSLLSPTLATHHHPHLDEFAAIALALRFGRFPNGEEVRVLFGGDYPPDSIVIGDGHGPFDEHRSDGRLPDTCSAMLVAEYLRVRDYPELKVILDEVLRADTKPGQMHLELAQVLKTMLSFGETPKKMLSLVRRVIDARIRMDRGTRPVAKKSLSSDARVRPMYAVGDSPTPISTIVLRPEYTVTDLATVWFLLNYPSNLQFEEDGVNTLTAGDEDLEALHTRDDVLYVGIPGGHFGPDGEIKGVEALMRFVGVKKLPSLGVIRKELQRWEGETSKPFELPALVELMRDHSEFSPEEVYTLLVEAMFFAQRESGLRFHVDTPRNFRQNGEMFEVEDLSVAMVTSDLSTMNSWCRSKAGADVVLQRTSDGNVQVFTKTQHALAVGFIAREIAIAEGATNQQLQELEEQIADGTEKSISGLDHWYLFQKKANGENDGAGMLLNGSQSHPDVPPTQLSDAELKDAVLRGVAAYEASLHS